jgi:putative heme transporter
VIAAGPARRPGTVRRLLTGPAGRVGLTVAVVAVIFAGVLPRIADYEEAWGLVRAMTWPEILLVGAVAVVNLISYAPLWTAAVPGLGWGRALLADQASTAVSNTVPAGFAFGVGTTAAMYHSFGFSPAVITRAVALTGLWNNLVKLVMPTVALGGLALTGDATATVTTSAVLGTALLLVVVGALVGVVAHPRTGATLAATAERLARRPARILRLGAPVGWVERTDRFRRESLELLRHRWIELSAAAVASHVALFLVLLTCLRAVDGGGADVSWLLVLAVFAVTRLITMVPITPGALGVAELSYVAGLTAVGVGPAAAAGAVLLFRFLTWFLPIPLGAAAWLLWRRGVGHARRTPDAVSSGATA